MSLSQKLSVLRKKPRKVRERILLVAMIIIGVILLVVWYLTYKYEPLSIGKNFAEEVVGGLSKSFSDPVYDDTFKTPSIEQIQNGPGAEKTQ